MSLYAVIFERKEFRPVFDCRAVILEGGIKYFFPMGAGGIMVVVARDKNLWLGYSIKKKFGSFELRRETCTSQISSHKEQIDTQRPEKLRQVGQRLMVALFFSKEEPIKRPCEPFHTQFKRVEVDAGKMDIGNLYNSHILHERV